MCQLLHGDNKNINDGFAFREIKKKYSYPNHKDFSLQW